MPTIRNKNILLLALALLLCVHSFCQETDIETKKPVYADISWELDGYIFGSMLILGGLEVLGTEQTLDLNKNGVLEESEVSIYDRSDINGFDRGATYNYDKDAGKKSDFYRNWGTAVPLTLLLLKKPRTEIGKIGFMFLEVAALNTSAALVAKKTVRRVRPLVYNENVPLEEKITNSATRSFYSGHTAHVSSLTFFTAKIIHDMYPDSNWKYAAWAGAAIIPALAGYYRYEAGKHFPTDIIAGYGVGALFGILVPQFRKYKEKTYDFGLIPISGGAMMDFSMRF